IVAAQSAVIARCRWRFNARTTGLLPDYAEKIAGDSEVLPRPMSGSHHIAWRLLENKGAKSQAASSRVAAPDAANTASAAPAGTAAVVPAVGNTTPGLGRGLGGARARASQTQQQATAAESCGASRAGQPTPRPAALRS